MVAREFASGKAFVHEHTDVYGRPVIVINAQKHVTGQSHRLPQSGEALPGCMKTLAQAFRMSGGNIRRGSQRGRRGPQG